jgi:hypothetical protein
MQRSMCDCNSCCSVLRGVVWALLTMAMVHLLPLRGVSHPAATHQQHRVWSSAVGLHEHSMYPEHMASAPRCLKVLRLHLGNLQVANYPAGQQIHHICTNSSGHLGALLHPRDLTAVFHATCDPTQVTTGRLCSFLASAKSHQAE